MMKSLLLSVFLSTGLSYQLAGETNTGYECQYLSSHKELSCQCSRHNMNIANLAELISSTHSQVESLKLEYCQSIDLRLDVVRVSQPFYQVRVEAADQVRLHGVGLGQTSSLDIVIRNVKHSVDVFGDISCDECSRDQGDDVRLRARPTLILQVKNTTNASLHYLDVSDVNMRLSIRNVENFNIDTTVLDTLAKNAIEVWYSKKVEITNSVVRESEEQAIVANHVDTLRLHNTVGILNSSLLLMSDNTEVEMTCTAEYLRDATVRPLSWSEELCSPLSLEGIQSRTDLRFQSNSSRTGTIVLTIACGLVVFIVIIVLCYLNKTGKLHNML